MLRCAASDDQGEGLAPVARNPKTLPTLLPSPQVLLASRRAEGEAGRLAARWEAVVCEPTWLEVREEGGRGQAGAPPPSWLHLSPLLSSMRVLRRLSWLFPPPSP